MSGPSEFKGRTIFMSMFNDISWGFEDTDHECNANADLVSFFFCKKIPNRPQGEWDRVAELMMIKFGESAQPVFRATSPLSLGTLKSKGGGKLSIHFGADQGTIETFSHNFLLISSVFTEQSQKCVKNVTPAMIEQ